MGCSSSREIIKPDTEKESDEKDVPNPEDVGSVKYLENKLSIYHSVKFSQNFVINSNLLLFTNYLNTASEFNSFAENTVPKIEKGTFKSSNHSIAVGYRKGYKLEFVNQDKLCVFLNGNIDAFIIIDGHGYFGNKLAQICQDALFEFVLNLPQNKDLFIENYQKEFENIFIH